MRDNLDQLGLSSVDNLSQVTANSCQLTIQNKIIGSLCSKWRVRYQIGLNDRHCVLLIKGEMTNIGWNGSQFLPQKIGRWQIGLNESFC